MILMKGPKKGRKISRNIELQQFIVGLIQASHQDTVFGDQVIKLAKDFRKKSHKSDKRD